eukprot:380828-Prymnesium_polylepis.1
MRHEEAGNGQRRGHGQRMGHRQRMEGRAPPFRAEILHAKVPIKLVHARPSTSEPYSLAAVPM